MEQWEQAIQQKMNPPVPSEIENRITRTLHRLPRQQRRRRTYYALPALVLAVVMLFGATAFSPALAETVRSIPVIGSIFELVGNVGERKAGQDRLASPFGQQAVIDGNTVTFTESLYDGTSIHIGYLNESGSHEFWPHVQVSIDGEPLMDYSSYSGGRTLADGSFAGIHTIRSGQALPDAFTLELSSRDEPSWHVAIPMEVRGDEHVFLLNDARAWRDTTMVYDKLVFNATSTTLYVRWLTDEQGSNHPPVIHYQLFDDEGRVLQTFGNGAKGRPTEAGQYVFVSDFIYEPVEPLPQSLTIKPYVGSGSPTGTATGRWEGDSFELSQGEAGSLRIERVERKDHTYTMTYEVEGELTAQRTTHVWMENQHGARYEVVRSPQRVEGTANRYQAAFASPNPDDDVIIGTAQFQPIDYLEDLIMTFTIAE